MALSAHEIEKEIHALSTEDKTALRSSAYLRSIRTPRGLTGLKPPLCAPPYIFCSGIWGGQNRK